MLPVRFAGEEAAAKILCEDVRDGGTRKFRRFQDEYRLLARVEPCRHVVRLFHFEVLEVDDLRLPVIVMERCQQTLAALVIDSLLRQNPKERPSAQRMRTLLAGFDP